MNERHKIYTVSKNGSHFIILRVPSLQNLAATPQHHHQLSEDGSDHQILILDRTPQCVTLFVCRHTDRSSMTPCAICGGLLYSKLDQCRSG